MKKLISLSILMLLVLTVNAQETIQIVSADIGFEFIAKKVKGTFSGFQSSSKINLNNITESVFEGTVDVGSLDSGNFLRNWSLKSDKYFNEDDYPKIKFKSTKIKGDTNNFVVHGNLTIKNISQPIVITFKKNGNKLIGSSTVLSSDYDIVIIKKKKEDNKVNIIFTFIIK